MTDTPMTEGPMTDRAMADRPMADLPAQEPPTAADDEDLRRPPLYARVLRLKHVQPSGLLCFLFFEGALAIAVVLALAELVPWVAVPVLPIVVAVMVKLNDLLAGLLAARPPEGQAAVPRGRVEMLRRREVRHVSRDLADSLDPVDSPRQRFRQSARRRYR